MFAYCNNSPVIYYDQIGCAPTAQVDIDGDGTIDYYEYEYSFTVILDLEYEYSEFELSGTVYIFPTIDSKPSFDNAPKPDGFNPTYDLMVGYYLDIDKKTGEENPVLYAPQAHKTAWGVRTAMLECMRQYDDDFNTPWERSTPSLQVEYTMHQIFSFDRSAQDIDFDNKEEDFTLLHHLGKAIIRGTQKLWNLIMR